MLSIILAILGAGLLGAVLALWTVNQFDLTMDQGRILCWIYSLILGVVIGCIFM